MRASNSNSATATRAIASIRRLCCLGLGGQIAVPALLGELHGLIPSYSNQFFWAGPNQELANIYDEGDTPAGCSSLSERNSTTSASGTWCSRSPRRCGEAEAAR